MLESLLPDIGSRRILLKMDTQGYDTEVFKGLGSKLEHVYALQSEVSLISIYEGMPHWTESISLYEKSRVWSRRDVSRDAGRGQGHRIRLPADKAGAVGRPPRWAGQYSTRQLIVPGIEHISSITRRCALPSTSVTT